MLEILIRLDAERVLREIRASGHAGDAAKGTNIVCSAATSLIRSAYRTVISEKDIRCSLKADEPGQIDFFILFYEEQKSEWLRGITDYLLTGLTDLDNEYPEFFEINITIIEGDINGS